MLAHVVISFNILSLEEVIAIKFHFLARDTRTQLNSLSNLCAISEFQRIHLVEALGFCGHGYIKNTASQIDEVFTIGNKVCFALQADHGTEAVFIFHENTSVRGLTVRTLSSDGQTTFTNKLDCFIDITISFGKGFLAVSQTGTGHLTQLLDVSYCNSHSFFVFCIKKVNNNKVNDYGRQKSYP